METYAERRFREEMDEWDLLILHPVLRYRNAVDLCPAGDPNKHSLLAGLGSSLVARFGRFSQLTDLEDAISCFQNAVDLVPDGHPDEPGYLTNIGNSLFTRFRRLSQATNLEGAITRHKKAVDLGSDSRTEKLARLHCLGSSLKARFRRFWQLNDLEAATSRFRDAVDLAPDSHPNKATYLDGLSGALLLRFKCLGELADLENASSTIRDAYDLTLGGHSLKISVILSSIGDTSFCRFQHLGQLDDLEDAISRYRDTVDLTPDGHFLKPECLHDLGKSFKARFEHLGQLSDLDDATLLFKDAISLLPAGHPNLPGGLDSLGDCFNIRFEPLGDLGKAISLFSHAASTPIGPASARFHACRGWISCARRISHPSLLHAYSAAISLLPQLDWVGQSLSNRYHILIERTDIVREAAAAALDLGFPETAVEWLEQGRSIIWGKALQLRSSDEKLSSAHPDHARRLHELSVALDSAGATHENSLSGLVDISITGFRPTEFLDRLKHQADHRIELALQRDELLREIRRLPGFEHFLLRKPFSQLRTSEHPGPVVILNAAESRCDALIVLADIHRAIHGPLPKFTAKRCTDLQHSMKGFRRGLRDGKVVGEDRASWESLLSPLWKCVVKPVLDALALSTPGNLSRIFRCPTGPFPFLPIHAAGFYDSDHLEAGHKVFDFVVSSYVPTLSILAPSRDLTVPASCHLHLLAVHQPPSDGHSPLPGVDAELRYIKDLVQNPPLAKTTLLESSVGTVEEVLGLMKDADWVHFACHGVQDGLDSGFCLADRRRLKLRDIVGLSRPRGGLAFLSACQTAKAGMLFAGYGGVIGTMWSISDHLAPRVAKDVYEELFRDGRPDYRDAARALHDAVGRLRDRKVSFVDWLPFIHVGL